MAKTEGLRELYVDELRDLYDAEHRLIKALPKMAKAADSEELRSGFEHHLQQTKGHAQRLEQIFESMGEQAKAKKCKGIEGIVDESSELLGEDFKGAVKDAAIIASAQRVEHYEIAAYGSVRSFAEQLGETKAASLLQQTLNEEKETDAKLTQMSQSINALAAGGASETKGRAARA
ncbi:MAG: ferritin-like domain-containing protein [Candidatus Acidiferrales bacterium]